MLHEMTDTIVADGCRRLREAPEVERQIARATKRIQARYEPFLGRVGLFRRIIILRRMNAMIERTVEKHAPSDALYFLDVEPEARQEDAEQLADGGGERRSAP